MGKQREKSDETALILRLDVLNPRLAFSLRRRARNHTKGLVRRRRDIVLRRNRLRDIGL